MNIQIQKQNTTNESITKNVPLSLYKGKPVLTIENVSYLFEQTESTIKKILQREEFIEGIHFFRASHKEINQTQKDTNNYKGKSFTPINNDKNQILIKSYKGKHGLKLITEEGLAQLAFFSQSKLAFKIHRLMANQYFDIKENRINKQDKETLLKQLIISQEDKELVNKITNGIPTIKSSKLELELKSHAIMIYEDIKDREFDTYEDLISSFENKDGFILKNKRNPVEYITIDDFIYQTKKGSKTELNKFNLKLIKLDIITKSLSMYCNHKLTETGRINGGKMVQIQTSNLIQSYLPSFPIYKLELMYTKIKNKSNIYQIRNKPL